MSLKRLPLLEQAVEQAAIEQADVRPVALDVPAGGRLSAWPAAWTKRTRVRRRQLSWRAPIRNEATEAWALRLLGEIARASLILRRCEPAETHYRQALALAEELGMRPLVAHCHLGLGKLYRRTGKRRAGAGAPHHRDDDVPRDGHALLAGAGRGGPGHVGGGYGIRSAN